MAEKKKESNFRKAQALTADIKNLNWLAYYFGSKPHGYTETVMIEGKEKKINRAALKQYEAIVCKNVRDLGKRVKRTKGQRRSSLNYVKPSFINFINAALGNVPSDEGKSSGFTLSKAARDYLLEEFKNSREYKQDPEIARYFASGDLAPILAPITESKVADRNVFVILMSFYNHVNELQSPLMPSRIHNDALITRHFADALAVLKAREPKDPKVETKKRQYPFVEQYGEDKSTYVVKVLDDEGNKVERTFKFVRTDAKNPNANDGFNTAKQYGYLQSMVMVMWAYLHDARDQREVKVMDLKERKKLLDYLKENKVEDIYNLGMEEWTKYAAAANVARNDAFKLEISALIMNRRMHTINRLLSEMLKKSPARKAAIKARKAATAVKAV